MRREHGFTLIELLIVVAIIGILAAIAVPNFLNAQSRALVSRTYADIRTLTTAFNAYSVDNAGRYPPDFNCGVLPDPKESCTYNLLTTPISYISSIPIDIWIPKTNEDYSQVLRYYEYWGKYTKGQKRIQLFSEHGVFYFLRSVGPDLTLQLDSDNLIMVLIGRSRSVYSTSNGIRSKGDFIATNRGIER